MPVIRLQGLTPGNAEKAIAALWYVLEQRGIESPRIATRSDGEHQVAIEITFKVQRDADSVLAALHRSSL